MTLDGAAVEHLSEDGEGHQAGTLATGPDGGPGAFELKFT